jgi:regulator of protease activity HflC (stomatin/prohibitin superfamily)
VLSTVVIVLLVLGAVALLLSRSRLSGSTRAGAPQVRRGVTVAAWGGIALAVLIAFFSCTTIVPTKDVGILLTLQRPSGTLANGFHVKQPWQQVQTMDAAIQTDNHVPDGETSDGAERLNCVTVRIAHQSQACVDATVRWQIVLREAALLYQDYRGFDKVRDSLVTRDLTTALAQEMESYDPLAIDPKSGQSTAPAFSDIAQRVVSDMNTAASGRVTIDSISIPVVRFDTQTTARIQQIQAQIAQTQVAKQAEQTAIAQAAANKALAASVSKDPNVLVSKCLDIVQEAVNKGATLPAGFSCNGSSSAVVVPSK